MLALSILAECTGETIWTVDYAAARGVPPDWIDALSDAFESGFDDDRDTIYVGPRAVGQFHGIRDIDLCRRIAQLMHVDLDRIEAQSMSRRDLYRRIVEAIEEG